VHEATPPAREPAAWAAGGRRRRLPVATLTLLVVLVSTLALTADSTTADQAGRGPTVAPGVTAAEAQRDLTAARVRAELRRQVAAALRHANAPPSAPLTGVEVSGEQLVELERQPAAVVKIPNNAEARPHTGIEQADIVYEQETEGGTTRFAAVFHSQIPEVVGNIRSARFVDVDLVAPYGAVFVYAGARGEVLEQIETAGLVSVGAGGPGYFTTTARRPPHHLYSRLREAIAERPEATPPPRAGWAFDPEPPEGGIDIEGRVRVVMSHIAATSWEYDPEVGVFRRFQNDLPHEVTGPERIGAANVVLLDIEVRERDSHNAPVYRLEGEGDALLLRDGRAYEIAWAKAGTTEQLELLDGIRSATLAPGPTWVMLTYDGTVDDVIEELEQR
jgi:hypothetical protein